MITAMILAGGSGSRVGAGRPKQFVEILGKPVLAYTIELYQKNPQVDAIEIVCHADWIHYLETIIENYRLSKVKWITHGGETFQESVINGVNYLKDKLDNNDMVMIHYGAAPFTSQNIISDVIRAACLSSESSFASFAILPPLLTIFPLRCDYDRIYPNNNFSP